MGPPLQITFRDISSSPAVEDAIRKRTQKLAHFYDRITSCHVTVEAPHRRHHGGLYRILIDLRVPEGEIVVGRDPTEAHEHEDIYVAIRDAFDAARRRLEDHARRHRGRGEAHEPPPHGRVVRLFSDDGYGLIESSDGREIYFHRNSVVGGFDRLEVGAEVRFDLHEGEGEHGPQASTVKLVGKHHVPERDTR